MLAIESDLKRRSEPSSSHKYIRNNCPILCIVTSNNTKHNKNYYIYGKTFKLRETLKGKSTKLIQ